MKRFTLFELLIIIAVIGILMTLLLPSLSQSKELSIRAVCLSNQQQIYRGQIYSAKDKNGKFAESVNVKVRYFKARDIDAMGLCEAVN